MATTTAIRPLAADPVVPSRLSAAALITGGSLMMTMYALTVVHGFTHGGQPPSVEASLTEPLLYASGMTFCLALILVALGLVGLGFALRPRSPKLATIGLALPLIFAAAPALNILLGLGITGERTFIGPIAALSVLANLIGALLLGIAALRTRSLSRPIGWTLIAVGLVTFPVILLTIPAEQFFPSFIVADLPFPVWGIIFAMIGMALWRGATTVEAGR
jgi:hypothetical protein